MKCLTTAITDNVSAYIMCDTADDAFYTILMVQQHQKMPSKNTDCQIFLENVFIIKSIQKKEKAQEQDGFGKQNEIILPHNNPT